MEKEFVCLFVWEEELLNELTEQLPSNVSVSYRSNAQCSRVADVPKHLEKSSSIQSH
jgi:hypothetical protein